MHLTFHGPLVVAERGVTKQINLYPGKLLLGIQGTKTLEQILDVYKVFEEDDGDEKRLALEFLRSMLRLKPSDRATAAELLSHPWLKC